MDYFKPLRRKIGVFTLVMACVLLAGRARSHYQIDTAIIPLGAKHAAWLWSADSSLCWNTTELRDDAEPFYPQLYSRDFTEDDARILEHPYWGIHRKWSGLGFELLDDGSTKVVVPYLTLMIPLMLLSAWLLLSRPRVGRVNGGYLLVDHSGRNPSE